MRRGDEPEFLGHVPAGRIGLVVCFWLQAARYERSHRLRLLVAVGPVNWGAETAATVRRAAPCPPSGLKAEVFPAAPSCTLHTAFKAWVFRVLCS